MINDMMPVKSSLIERFGYYPDLLELRVVFKSNPEETYVYDNVNETVYHDMLKAESKGAYFSANVKNQFEFLKVKNTVDA